MERKYEELVTKAIEMLNEDVCKQVLGMYKNLL